ncbi:esterase B1 [Drosophila madeirensis]|uniref:carboxylesterase n=1 Tax=Drosophila madeirensis TaxID=30013 RepID=A0AAU9F6Z8_DROMD
MWKLCVSGSTPGKYLQFVYRSLRLTARRSSAETKIVDLPMGRLKGRRQCGIYGDSFFSFEGIPFGKPPLGELRFVAPEPAEPWTDQELDAQQERHIPLQMEFHGGKTIGSEDCLYLNVYTKHFDKTKPPLPVMVYIYGGAFRTGGATRKMYGPDYLMSKDIVYVIFNYRLCALGFLSLPSIESNVPGNAGLHDQLLALKWIKQHIQKFNGDPENITLFGESAGAVGVHFMMCLPQAMGLFHKAIMMSGSMLSPWVQIPDRTCLYSQLALSAGYAGPRREKDMLRYLRWVEAKKLLEYAHNCYTFHDRCFGFLYPFVPMVEEANYENGLMQQPYLEMMRDAWSVKVPLLLGGTSFEGLVYYPFLKLNNGLMLDLLKQEPELVLPYELFVTMSDEVREARAKELVKYHYGPRGITKNNVTQLLDLFSYKLFWHGLHRVVRSRLAHAQAPTYLYRFDFDSPSFNLVRNKLCGDDIKRGVCHADDMGYVFHKKGVQKLPLDSAEYLTIQRMVGILTAFAKTGDPNCVETESEEWTPVTAKLPYRALNIGHDLDFITQYEKDGLKVWNRLYEDEIKLYGG